MLIRNWRSWRTLIVPLAAGALLLTACGGDDDTGDGTATGATETAEPPAEETAAGTATDTGTTAAGTDTGAATVPSDGPEIVVASFNFPESVILGNIYLQALEDAGYPVSSEFNLGARELIFSDLQSGAIDFLPEYVGSSLAVGFGGEATADTDETLGKLQEAFTEFDVAVLEPAPAQDKNVFVVTQDYADQNGLTAISDLAGVDGAVRFGGPPECQERETCLLGLTDTYGLDNVEFQTIQETPVRVQSLANGQIDLALMFSTDPAIQEQNLVALEDDQGLVPAENVVPVVRQEVIDAYGDDFTSLVNDISSQIETETLIDLNGRAASGTDPADVAAEWLAEAGIVSG